jgi:hypothetical protein
LRVGERQAVGVAKHGSPSGPEAEDRIADHRGDEARDDRFQLEVADVQDLRREDRATQRRLEYRADARPHSDRDRDAAIARGKAEEVA